MSTNAFDINTKYIFCDSKREFPANVHLWTCKNYTFSIRMLIFLRQADDSVNTFLHFVLVTIVLAVMLLPVSAPVAGFQSPH